MPYTIVEHGFCCDTGHYSKDYHYHTLAEALEGYWVHSDPMGSDGDTRAALYSPHGDRLDPPRGYTAEEHDIWLRFRLMTGYAYRGARILDWQQPALGRWQKKMDEIRMYLDRNTPTKENA